METAEQKLARLEAENLALRNQVSSASTTRSLTVKVSEKGGVQINGFGRFPVTLYVEQMERFIAFVPELKTWIAANRKSLKTKADQVIAKAA